MKDVRVGILGAGRRGVILGICCNAWQAPLFAESFFIKQTDLLGKS